MILKEAKYNTCECCGNHKRVSEPSYGCDNCMKPIDDLLQSGNTKYAEYLEVKVFSNTEPTVTLHFCSWFCVFTHLPKIESDYFVSLPYISYEQDREGQTVDDFFAAVTNFRGTRVSR